MTQSVARICDHTGCAAYACYGLGPPIRATAVWYCPEHYQQTQEHQQWVSEKIEALSAS